jgi:hypothetical protein
MKKICLKDWEKVLNKIFVSHENSRSPHRKLLVATLPDCCLAVGGCESERITGYLIFCIAIYMKSEIDDFGSYYTVIECLKNYSCKGLPNFSSITNRVCVTATYEMQT